MWYLLILLYIFLILGQYSTFDQCSSLCFLSIRFDSHNLHWSYWSHYGVPLSYRPHGFEQFSPLFRPSTEISHLISRILVFTTYVVIGTNSAELAKSAWTGFPLKVPASPHRLGVSFICWPLLQVAVKFWSPVLLLVCGENPSSQASSNYGPTTN